MYRPKQNMQAGETFENNKHTRLFFGTLEYSMIHWEDAKKVLYAVLDRRPKFYGHSRRFSTYGYGYGGRSLRPFLRPKVLLVVFLV